MSIRGFRIVGDDSCRGPYCVRKVDFDSESQLCELHKTQQRQGGGLTEVSDGTVRSGGYQSQPAMEEAACRDTEVEFFDIRNAGQGRKAAALCGVCPVQAACLDYAERTQEGSDPYPAVGVWGGTWFQMGPGDRSSRKAPKVNLLADDLVAAA